MKKNIKEHSDCVVKANTCIFIELFTKHKKANSSSIRGMSLKVNRFS